MQQESLRAPKSFWMDLLAKQDKQECARRDGGIHVGSGGIGARYEARFSCLAISELVAIGAVNDGDRFGRVNDLVIHRWLEQQRTWL